MEHNVSIIIDNSNGSSVTLCQLITRRQRPCHHSTSIDCYQFLSFLVMNHIEIFPLYTTLPRRHVAYILAGDTFPTHHN